MVMKRLLVLILAILALAAPVPALAMQAMCADTMPMTASMNGMHAHDKQGSCCDDKHKACVQACEATCVAALVAPAGIPSAGALEPANPPLAARDVFTTAKMAMGLDRPPRPTV